MKYCKCIHLKQIAVAFLIANITFLFFNNNKYFLLSGFYYLLIPSILFGTLNIVMNKKVKINYGVICSLILIFSTIMGSIIAGDMSVTGVMLSFFLIFIEMFVFFSIEIDKSYITLLLDSIKYAAIILAVLLFITRVDYWGGEWRFSVKVGNGPIFDPNYLGAIISSGLAISLYMVEFKKDRSVIRIINYICNKL